MIHILINYDKSNNKQIGISDTIPLILIYILLT